MELDDALRALPNVEWNPVALTECYEKMVLEGCFLPSTDEGAQLPLIGGIQFRPQLQFNKANSLTNVSLIHRAEGTETSTECLNTYARAVDGMAKKYGGVSYVSAPKSDNVGWAAKSKRSEVGLDLPYMSQKDGTYVTEVMRTHRPSEVSGDPKEASAQWAKQSHVSALSSYIWVNGVSHCDISVAYTLGESAQVTTKDASTLGF